MTCDWIGWCALDSSAQAAWAQAVFSVVGIAIAIWVPARASRLDRKRKVDAILALLTSMHIAMCDVLEMIKPGADMRGVVVHKERLDRFIAAADAIPFHDLPEAGLAYPLISMLDNARVFSERSGWLTDVRNLPTAAAPVQTQMLGSLADAYHAELMHAYRAANERVLSAWDRLRDWWTLRPNRAAVRRVTQRLRKAGERSQTNQ